MQLINSSKYNKINYYIGTCIKMSSIYTYKVYTESTYTTLTVTSCIAFFIVDILNFNRSKK